MNAARNRFAVATNAKEIRWHQEQARDAFVHAAALLTGIICDPGEALVHAAMGTLHLAASDPRERARLRAEDIVRALGERGGK